MLSHLRPALVLTSLFVLLTGVLYPLAVTGAAGFLFPSQAEGSLVRAADGHVLGSRLIAQNFTRSDYFHPRGSSAGSGFDGANSSGSNLGPMDKKLIDRIAADAANYRKDNPGQAIPADAVTQSGSGLDPDISPQNARSQAPRIAHSRDIPVEQVARLIDRNTEAPVLGFLGQPRVNVFLINRALDQTAPHPSKALTITN